MVNKSTHTTMNISFARVLRAAAQTYLDAQAKILGRRLAFTQLVNDALIEKLEREGFLPKLSQYETLVPSGEPASEEEELPPQLSPDSPDEPQTEPPWDKAD